MSEDKAKEIIAESVAEEVVESIGEDLVAALVEYANLVKELAADLTYEQLKDMTYIKSLLGGQLPNWDKRYSLRIYWKDIQGWKTVTVF